MYLCCALSLGLVAQVTAAQADALSAQFEAKKQALNAQYQANAAQQIDRFAKAKAAYAASFYQAQQAYQGLWEVPELSSASRWVSYSDDKTTRRIVDFATGELSVELLGTHSQAHIDAVVKSQTQALLNETQGSALRRDPVLGQLVQGEGQADKVFTQLDESTLLASKEQSVSAQAQGESITRVSMRLPQDALTQRAVQFLPSIEKYSKQWQIEPSLILAIMHIESHFNPVAQSHIPAFGLMQIVPSSAGRDVTRLVQGKERLLSADELFQPNFNIDIGSAYLNILDQRYLKGIRDPLSRSYVAIAAYNGGVGAVAKHFSGQGSLSKLAERVNQLKPAQVYNSLVNDFPYAETRNYLSKVEAKRLHYAKFI